MGWTRLEVRWDIKKKVMTETIDGKRPGGRPRQRRRHTVRSDLQLCAPGSKLEDSEDRVGWQEIVEAAKALNWL